MKLKWVDKWLDKKSILFIDQLLYRFNDDGVIGIGAQMTYFLILSFFPFLIVFLNTISYTPLVSTEVLQELIHVLPIDTQKIIVAIVAEIVQTSSQGLLSFAFIGGIWAAASGLYFIIKSINKAYDYEETRSYWTVTWLSIVFTIALLALLTLVFLTLVFGEVLGRQFFSYIGQPDIFYMLWSYFRITISLLYMILTFALLYKFSPCMKKGKKILFKDTLPGAIFASFGWFVTSTIFSYYVNNFGVFSLAYGSLGGAIILLIWLFISSIIMILGGEVNATIEYFKLHGLRLHPEKSFIYNYRKKFR